MTAKWTKTTSGQMIFVAPNPTNLSLILPLSGLENTRPGDWICPIFFAAIAAFVLIANCFLCEQSAVGETLREPEEFPIIKFIENLKKRWKRF